MSDVMLSRELAIKVCKAFDLDPDKVSRITIDLQAGDVARVDVLRYITKGEGEEIAGLFNEYKNAITVDTVNVTI